MQERLHHRVAKQVICLHGKFYTKQKLNIDYFTPNLTLTGF
jgi:hypothetical protein